MQHWFYTMEGKNLGPMSSKTIADLVLKGRLEIDTVIVSEQDSTRSMIKEIPEIMQIIHTPMSHAIVSDIDAAQFGDFHDADAPLENHEALFYNLPARTLLIVQLITLGLFEWYWFFKQWNYLRFHTRGRRVSYFLAVSYMILFAYRVFSDIETNKDLNKVKRPVWNARTLALLWYLVIPLMLFNPLRYIGILSGILSLMVIFMLTTFVLIPVQKYINEVNEALKLPYSKPGFGFYVVTISSILPILLIIYLNYF